LFVDGRSLNGEQLTPDICIIGGGAAGISLALQFIDQQRPVVLLESGGFELDGKTQALYEGENKSFTDFPLEATRLRYFGGTTNHWGGFTYELRNFDFTPRPYMPVSGWPIPLSQIASYYPGAGKLCQLGEMDYTDIDGLQRRAGYAPLPLSGQPMRPEVALFSPPTRFGTVYREALRRANSVKVILNSNAQELIADDSAARIERVLVRCIGGARYEVSARVFVIAMGGIETPRLLLLSRRQQAAGLGNQNDLVGRYYMDHPGFTGGQFQFSRGAPNLDFFMGYHKVKGNRVYGIFTPRPDVLIKEDIGDFRIQLSPFESVPGVASVKRLAEHPFSVDTLTELGFHIGNVLVDLDQVANAVYRTALHRKEGFLGDNVPARRVISGATMAVSAEQVPNPDSRVTLCDETDVFGQQRVRLTWRLQDVDRRTLARSFRLFAQSVSAAGYGRVRVPPELGTLAADPLIEIACHQMGTTRMSDSPKSGVVNGDCKVHGISNLYIASSAVFPRSSWVNPTLTIVALALRLADHIKSTYS
jgi:choline dehydrogenase-like flavoprotein